MLAKKFTKKILHIENMFNYDLGICMRKFKRNTLPFDFISYVTSVNKIHNLLKRFAEKNYSFPK